MDKKYWSSPHGPSSPVVIVSNTGEESTLVDLVLGPNTSVGYVSLRGIGNHGYRSDTGGYFKLPLFLNVTTIRAILLTELSGLTENDADAFFSTAVLINATFSIRTNKFKTILMPNAETVLEEITGDFLLTGAPSMDCSWFDENFFQKVVKGAYLCTGNHTKPDVPRKPSTSTDPGDLDDKSCPGGRRHHIIGQPS
ncbi:hypothetical protein B0H67DRAFT_644211 [Lasiosphaeris hirsuta]|uniref:Uncharacterized protein n=1 Tax=Lasiosphaeris hirsuta TaxID=260670 RepID=A0AA40DYD9_9PEZI|nr:hypothetical protein B0H67DRAFT_644211 [Lasiosphaeris hirsuta]